jgi:glycosyltransferase involved in cell wall biosynthesis
MRILQVIPTIDAAGAERMVANLARYLRRAGHDVCVVSLMNPGSVSVEPDLKSNGVQVYLLGKRMGVDVRMVPRLARVLAHYEPEVAHTHLHVLKYLLAAMAYSRRCPIVHTVHNLADREVTRGDVLVHQVAFRAGVAAVAIGDAVAQSMRQLYRKPPRRIIPNGIPVDDYASPPGIREEMRASLRIPPDAPTFVNVGLFREQKNHAALLAAFASERLSSLSAHLLLAGDGVLRDEVERQARQLGVAERVRFLGSRKDIPRVLAAADVFVLSSRWEGHPLSVMEAMAAGKPVVATAVGCVPENVSRSTGRLVAEGDVAALGSAMFELANDMPLTRTLGSAAARTARERFDASVMGRAYEELYSELSVRATAGAASPRR